MSEPKTGKVYKFRGLRFYAQNGFICLHDEDDGTFLVLTRREFLERAAALSDEVKRLRVMAAENPGRKFLSEDRMDIQFGIENMIECTKEAKEQGDRTDPEVDAWFAKHRPNKKSKISLASAANFATTMPGVLPLGNDTGKHVSPDFSFNTGHQPKKLILPGE